MNVTKGVRRRWPLLLVIVLVAALVGQRLFESARRAELYRAGEEAATAGRWAEAARAFLDLVERAPVYRDVETRLVEALEQDAVAVPGGWYAIGTPAGSRYERPRRLIYVDGFRIDRYEITNAQYRRFALATGVPAPRYWDERAYPAGHAGRPAVGVSWQQACDYCRWAGRRLPTETEWEAACAGPGGSSYPWGETWDGDRANVTTYPLNDLDRAWVLLRTPDAGEPTLAPVGSYPEGASPFGVLDLAGNASEWTLDWFTFAGYKDLPSHNPVGLGPEWNHSIRGSAWLDPHLPGSASRLSRCQARNSSHSYDDPRVGFRCAEGPGPALPEWATP